VLEHGHQRIEAAQVNASSTAASDTALTGDQYAEAYPPGIGRSYWHVARNRILWRLLRSRLSPRSQVLDIGCGPGIVVRSLRERQVACFGADLGTPPPEDPSVAPYLFLGQSAFELPAEFRQGIDTVLLMDVLEHLPSPHDFLAECGRAFPNVRSVCVTLPARMEIWSNYDEHYGHYLRYTRSGVAELAAKAGFHVASSGYAFHGLYAAARVAKLFGNRRSTALRTPSLTPVHTALGALFDLEERLLPSGLKGSSVVALLTR
jgi:SAM-dependent methyltransferase